MALTKAQVSLVTVATLGAAPGGFTADLLNFGSQVEVAALALSVSPTQAAQTNAEFALQVAKNLGATDALSLYKALEAGTSRADAVVDFANAQLVAQGGNIAKVKAAEASNSTSTDLTELVAVVTPKATAATDATIIEFKDNNTSAKPTGTNNDTSGAAVATEQTIAYIGKDQIINGKATKVAADFTFQLKDQIGESDTFKGQFLSPILDRKPADNTGSKVVLELRNLREAVDSVEPLKSLPTNGIAFTLNGALLKIADQGTNKAIDNALTYDDLRTAIENRLAELARGENLPDGASGESTDPAAYAQLASFTVEKGGLFTAQNEKGETVSGNQIVLTDKAGATLDPLAFTQSSDIIVGTGYTLYGELKKDDAKPITKLITTNLDADNVGYGSQGATVNIAGQSNSDKGVEELLVQAKNGVWFTKLESKSKAGTDHLQKITLKAGSEGSFRVGTQKNHDRHVVDLVDQQFTDVTALGVTTKGAGLVDVQQVEAGNVAGSTAINSFVSKDVLNRYTFKDTGKFDADESNITYNLSSGADVLNLAISTDVLEAVDTQVKVNTGSGDDFITVQATKGLTLGKVGAALQEVSTGNGWLINQQLNNNIVIDAGAGNDWILTPGAGNATIKAGAGDDVVRVDNAGDRGVYVFNNATTEIDVLRSQGLTSNSNNPLSNGANTIGQTQKLFKAQVKVTFKGFESKYVEIDSTNYTTSTKQINQAIKKAINDDPVLNKLIAAHDNEGNALAIESLIDGMLNTTELDINIIAPVANVANETAAAKAVREAEGKLMLTTDDLTKADKAYKLASGTTTASDLLTNATSIDALYNTELGTQNGAVVTTTTQGVATVAAVNEVQTVTLGATGTLQTGDTLTFNVDGGTVIYTAVGGPLTGAATIAAAVQTAITSNLLTGTATSGGAATGYAVTTSGSTVVFTHTGIAADLAPITVASANTSTTAGFVSVAATVAETTKGIAAVTPVDEVQSIDLSKVTVKVGETLTFTATGIDGGALTYTNTGAAELTGSALATDIAAATGFGVGTLQTVAVNATNTSAIDFTFTAGSAGTNIPDIQVSGTGAGVLTGGVSGAESDNVIDLGTGNDVLVMGTGALSNDTLKVEEYGLGKSTIVNFKGGTAPTASNDFDLIDFSYYLNSVNANGAKVTNTVASSALQTDNSVSIIDFNVSGGVKIAKNAITFDNLSEANVKAMINGTTDADNVFGNLNINAMSGTTGKTDNFVLMLHNNAVGSDVNNVGEYKAFHVTSAGGSTDVADVKLIGTFDFGASITLVDGNLA